MSEAAAALSDLRHALRTPLAVVFGFAELLAGEGVDEASRREWAQRISDAGAEIRTLVDEARID